MLIKNCKNKQFSLSFNHKTAQISEIKNLWPKLPSRNRVDRFGRKFDSLAREARARNSTAGENNRRGGASPCSRKPIKESRRWSHTIFMFSRTQKSLRGSFLGTTKILGEGRNFCWRGEVALVKGRALIFQHLFGEPFLGSGKSQFVRLF
jgi:hypothetical protein